VGGGGKPPLTKAERREIQERQRAAKAEKKAAEAAGVSIGASVSSRASTFTPKDARPDKPSAHGPTPSQPSSSNASPQQQQQTKATPDKSQALQPPQAPKSASSTSLGASGASAGGGGGGKGGEKKAPHAPVTVQYDDSRAMAKLAKKQIVQRAQAQKMVPLFLHLRQFERNKGESLSEHVGFASDVIHPAILRLGLQYAASVITGADSRAVAMLLAFKKVLSDYKVAQNKAVARDLDQKIKPLIQFLDDCRPKSISMGNAIKFLKLHISNLPPNISENEAREVLYQRIDGFLQEKIDFAGRVIAQYGASKICHGDVILVYAASYSVEQVLLKAADEGKSFRVIVVDSRPKLEGRQLLQRLVKRGLKCTYILVSSVSYIMKEVSKVIVGAYSMLSNGSVMARAGTASVALMAHAFNVPVIVCCETYKFTERVQLESISFNELGDPDEIVYGDQDGVLSNWKDVPNLKLLNLIYDVTPLEFVTMVVTEVGLIPPTSVPVILREYGQDALSVS